MPLIATVRQTMPAPCVGTKLKGGDFICDAVESLDECNSKYTTTGTLATLAALATGKVFFDFRTCHLVGTFMIFFTAVS